MIYRPRGGARAARPTEASGSERTSGSDKEAKEFIIRPLAPIITWPSREFKPQTRRFEFLRIAGGRRLLFGRPANLRFLVAALLARELLLLLLLLLLPSLSTLLGPLLARGAAAYLEGRARSICPLNQTVQLTR